jgi:hypothetical protein
MTLAARLHFNVEEWDAGGQIYETLAICRTSPWRASRDW